MRLSAAVRSLLPFTLLCASVAVPLRAQVGAPLSPPAACLKAAKDWLSAQVLAGRAANAAIPGKTDAERLELDLALSRTVVRGAAKRAADCAAPFNLNTIPAIQLIDLIPLYNYIGDTASSRLANARMMTADLPPRARAESYRFKMGEAINQQPTVYGQLVDSAEYFVRKIDALPDSLAEFKYAAHKSMLGRYEYLDVAEGLQRHAQLVITMARERKNTTDMLMGYASLARSYADRLQPDSALQLLNVAEKELGDVATARFAEFRHRYALIGTKATAINANWWINTTAPKVAAPMRGQVTLIEFTAHWCGPCKSSYPGLIALAKEFIGRPFQGMLVTQLYGYLGTQSKLTPEAEVAADKIYYGGEHMPTFPVAINPPAVQLPDTPYQQPQPESDYRVGGIPQIVIVDKQGIIRQIITGWDEGNTARLRQLIEMLLRE